MARKIVRGLLIASCILALLMAALWIWTEETPDPLTACYGSKEYDIDRLEITPFLQGQLNDPVRVTEDRTMIEGYKKAYAWKNSNAICCDEDTTYIFTEYDDGKVIRRESYQSLLFSQYHNIGFRWKQFCLIHQIEPLYIWGGLICIGLVMALFYIRKHQRKTVPENEGMNMTKRAKFLKELRTDAWLVFWGFAMIVITVCACVHLCGDIEHFFREPEITTWETDPFLLEAQDGVICVGLFGILAQLVLVGPRAIRKVAKTACVMTVIAAVLSIIISYRVINLPLPWGEGIHEATRDSNMFLDFGLKAVGICAVSLALYLVIRRIQGKRALTTGENA